ncbi:hypothetical protein FSP39_014289 [Pinctada imbricata]|uniref:Mab-21-like HhH/H2TH-like domain-containing protein n=1 Tax=Pinctada imbricata TaxID=66713 RepID=A0AA88YGC1_PINIB|nr:hypothetical protein FSP39_014289 [Pinctada imbricata]
MAHWIPRNELEEYEYSLYGQNPYLPDCNGTISQSEVFNSAIEFKISPEEIIQQYINRWENDTHMSKIIDKSIQSTLGKYSNIVMRRKIQEMVFNLQMSSCGLASRMLSGSLADGFVLPGSDVDIMQWHDDHVIVQDSSLISRYRHTKPNIFLMHLNREKQGFVKLECISTETASENVRFSLLNIDGKQIVSSTKYLRYIYHKAHSSESQSINGPCIRSTTFLGIEKDIATCLRCDFWPDDIREFLRRRRTYDWPSPSQLEQISNEGIHLVSIGSRSQTISGMWVHDSIEWRYSFSLAEKNLVHLFNGVQFRIYGLMKMILNDLLIPHIPANTLCSYFIKTTMFWVIEESPNCIWRNDNVIHLLDLCLRKLIFYVYIEYCPNYFIPTQNIFHGKMYGVTSCQVYETLKDLYSIGFKCLTKCSLLPTLDDAIGKLELLRTFGSRQEIMSNNDSLEAFDALEDEFSRDLDFFRTMLPMYDAVPNKIHSLKALQAVDRMFQSEQLDPLTFDVAKSQHHRFSCEAGIALYHDTIQDSRPSNRRLKGRIYRILNHLFNSLDGDISKGYLTTATVHYLLGNLGIALDFLRMFRFKNKPFVIYLPRKRNSASPIVTERKKQLYIEAVCGRNLTMHEKTSLSLSFGFEAHSTMPVLPKDLLLELLLVRKTSYILSIHPLAYSLFLSFLCNLEMGHRRRALENLYELRSPNIELKKDYIAPLMTGICQRKVDDFDGALKSFAKGFHKKRRMAEICSYNGECVGWNSPLFYIALLLKRNLRSMKGSPRIDNLR